MKKLVNHNQLYEDWKRIRLALEDTFFCPIKVNIKKESFNKWK